MWCKTGCNGLTVQLSVISGRCPSTGLRLSCFAALQPAQSDTAHWMRLVDGQTALLYLGSDTSHLTLDIDAGQGITLTVDPEPTSSAARTAHALASGYASGFGAVTRRNPSLVVHDAGLEPPMEYLVFMSMHGRGQATTDGADAHAPCGRMSSVLRNSSGSWLLWGHRRRTPPRPGTAATIRSGWGSCHSVRKPHPNTSYGLEAPQRCGRSAHHLRAQPAALAQPPAPSPQPTPAAGSRAQAMHSAHPAAATDIIVANRRLAKGGHILPPFMAPA